MEQAVETEARNNPYQELIAGEFFPLDELWKGTSITDASAKPFSYGTLILRG